MVVEVTLDDRLEPRPRLRNRIVYARAELLLDLLQLSPQALGDRFAFENELPVLALPGNM